MIKKGIGVSRNKNSLQAGKQAAEMAMREADIDDKPDLVIVHSTEGYDNYEKLLEGVRNKTEEANLVGTLAGGIITQEGPDENPRTVGVMVMQSDQIDFEIAMVDNLREDSEKAGSEIGDNLTKNWPEKAKLLLTFPAGLSVNPVAFFRGLEKSLPEYIPFAGGLSGGNYDMKKTLQFFNDKVFSDAAVCVLLSGDFNFETAVSHGATPSKIKHIITKAERNIIKEFDGNPAVDIYKDYLDIYKDYVESDVDELSVFLKNSSLCLGRKVSDELKGEYEGVALRTPLDVYDDGSLFMTAEWPEGAEIFICERDSENIIKKAGEAANKIKKKIEKKGKEPEIVFHFDCLSRGKDTIGRKTAKREVRVSQKNLTETAPWFGWYTYGEIAPVGGRNESHNWTGVLLAIY